ncbi:hypothetical protein FHS61_003015 [Altererythrobacter atlanticus]|uniref:hypothetical protein n=1 Tax=Croceibacterium atlanticum TaxID=1267766 RepID=UPI000AA6A5FC|nr:hypothetical protein [Croceibacterium atlanticum]MBB5733968.1 hypothetical protein [Croceibacterium atlanticum]
MPLKQRQRCIARNTGPDQSRIDFSLPEQRPITNRTKHRILTGKKTNARLALCTALNQILRQASGKRGPGSPVKRQNVAFKRERR